MDHINVCTELLHLERKRYNSTRNEYRLDMWEEVKKRWLVFGVLVSVALAVLGPNVGAPGGPLHTEYLSYLPLSYIFYNAGQRYYDSKPVSICTMVLCLVHSHFVGPGLCLLIGGIFGWAGVDYRILRGALLTSVGGGCAWLSLGASHSSVTLLAVNYVTSLVVTPAAMFVLCGRATIPPLGGILSTILTSGAPFLFGAIISLKQHSTTQQQTLQHVTKQHVTGQHKKTKSHVCCLMLLYVVCCWKLSEAGGVLDVMPVLSTLALEVCCVSASAGACWLYRKCGVLQGDDVIVFITCAVPKSLDMGWESSTCPLSGLSRLPAAFLAPSQALLIAALVSDSDVYDALPQ